MNGKKHGRGVLRMKDGTSFEVTYSLKFCFLARELTD